MEADVRQAIDGDRQRRAAEVLPVRLAGPHDPGQPAGPRGCGEHVAEERSGVDNVPQPAVVLEGCHGWWFEHLAGQDRLSAGAMHRGSGNTIATVPVVGDHAAQDLRVGAVIVGLIGEGAGGVHRR